MAPTHSSYSDTDGALNGRNLENERLDQEQDFTELGELLGLSPSDHANESPDQVVDISYFGPHYPFNNIFLPICGDGGCDNGDGVSFVVYQSRDPGEGGSVDILLNDGLRVADRTFTGIHSTTDLGVSSTIPFDASMEKYYADDAQEIADTGYSCLKSSELPANGSTSMANGNDYLDIPWDVISGLKKTGRGVSILSRDNDAFELFEIINDHFPAFGDGAFDNSVNIHWGAVLSTTKANEIASIQLVADQVLEPGDNAVSDSSIPHEDIFQLNHAAAHYFTNDFVEDLPQVSEDTIQTQFDRNLLFGDNFDCEFTFTPQKNVQWPVNTVAITNLADATIAHASISTTAALDGVSTSSNDGTAAKNQPVPAVNDLARAVNDSMSAIWLGNIGQSVQPDPGVRAGPQIETLADMTNLYTQIERGTNPFLAPMDEFVGRALKRPKVHYNRQGYEENNSPAQKFTWIGDGDFLNSVSPLMGAYAYPDINATWASPILAPQYPIPFVTQADASTSTAPNSSTHGQIMLMPMQSPNIGASTKQQPKPKKFLKCDICIATHGTCRTYSRKQELKRHVETTHEGGGVACPHCAQTLSNEYSLGRHIKRKHAEHEGNETTTP